MCRSIGIRIRYAILFIWTVKMIYLILKSVSTSGPEGKSDTEKLQAQIQVKWHDLPEIQIWNSLTGHALRLVYVYFYI